MLYKCKVEPKELARRWQVFEKTEQCPCCDNHSFSMRKMVESPNQPAHWRYTCNQCKSQWFKLWFDVNTVEQA